MISPTSHFHNCISNSINKSCKCISMRNQRKWCSLGILLEWWIPSEHKLVPFLAKVIKKFSKNSKTFLLILAFFHNIPTNLLNLLPFHLPLQLFLFHLILLFIFLFLLNCLFLLQLGLLDHSTSKEEMLETLNIFYKQYISKRINLIASNWIDLQIDPVKSGICFFKFYVWLSFLF